MDTLRIGESLWTRRLEVGSRYWCAPPEMGEDHSGANPRSLQREFSAPGQTSKLTKCLSATGLTVVVWD